MAAAPDPFRLSVRFWGVRGSIPTPERGCLGVGGNTSCVEVRAADGTTLVLDAGTGARALGVAMTAEAGGRDAEQHVLFSHFHWDHLQGLPFFAPLHTPGNRVHFYAAQRGNVADSRLDALLQGQMCPPYFPVPFHEVGAATTATMLPEGEPFVIGGVTVRPFPLHHPQGAHGFRIEAGGASVVYATDYEHGVPAFDDGLRDVARGADLLISDAQFTPDEYLLRKGWGHTTYVEAARLAEEAGVGRLALFHHDPSHDDETLARIETATRGLFAATDLAVEGLEIRL